MVLAYLDFEQLSCVGCGGYLPETTDVENEGRYVAEPPGRCHRCDAIERQRKEYEDDETVPFPRALVVWVANLRRRNG
ncbi:hypothetical protein [Amycolatopsis sp. NPDC001319]|uniref:hypothetical protein n=1 Tax=unclassified Amycolatopsis TaxID=2618356 RepID=UPI0036ACB8C1